MITSDRILGLVVIVVALAYMVSANQIQTSFLSDPVGSKTFPYVISGIAILCGLVFIARPDPDPEWPDAATWLHIGIAVAVLIAYAYTLKPLGFLLPTAVAASVLSYQIHPRAAGATIAGIGLSVGLYFVFKYALGLGLVALPRALIG